MLGANIAALVWYMASNNQTVGLSMLGATATLSSIMGLTLTAAIGGKHVDFSLKIS